MSKEKGTREGDKRKTEEEDTRGRGSTRWEKRGENNIKCSIHSSQRKKVVIRIPVVVSFLLKREDRMKFGACNEKVCTWCTYPLDHHEDDSMDLLMNPSRAIQTVHPTSFKGEKKEGEKTSCSIVSSAINLSSWGNLSKRIEKNILRRTSLRLLLTRGYVYCLDSNPSTSSSLIHSSVIDRYGSEHIPLLFCGLLSLILKNPTTTRISAEENNTRILSRMNDPSLEHYRNSCCAVQSVCQAARLKFNSTQYPYTSSHWHHREYGCRD